MRARTSALALGLVAAANLAAFGLCCGGGNVLSLSAPAEPLAQLRQRHETQWFDVADPTPPPEPPAQIFELIQVEAPLGQNAAYVSPVGDGPRPGIVWIAGGFSWSVGDWAWEPATRDNDQTAAGLRQAGIALLLPSTRGFNGNPGRSECFYGEVEDVLAAADALAARPDVDPDRVFLGGHSTGATMALLAAASAPDRFRGVVALGPIDDPRNYGECVPYSETGIEAQVRAPVLFVDEIRSPTLILEGGEYGNTDALFAFDRARGQAPVQTVLVPGHDHFTLIAPAIDVVAERILADDGQGSFDWAVSAADVASE